MCKPERCVKDAWFKTNSNICIKRAHRRNWQIFRYVRAVVGSPVGKGRRRRQRGVGTALKDERRKGNCRWNFPPNRGCRPGRYRDVTILSRTPTYSFSFYRWWIAGFEHWHWLNGTTWLDTVLNEWVECRKIC